MRGRRNAQITILRQLGADGAAVALHDLAADVQPQPDQHKQIDALLAGALVLSQNGLASRARAKLATSVNEWRLLRCKRPQPNATALAAAAREGARSRSWRSPSARAPRNEIRSSGRLDASDPGGASAPILTRCRIAPIRSGSTIPPPRRYAPTTEFVRLDPLGNRSEAVKLATVIPSLLGISRSVAGHVSVRSLLRRDDELLAGSTFMIGAVMH